MKFTVVYNTKPKDSRFHRYDSITETISAKGIMHAAKLANDHAVELTKTLNMKVTVYRIKQLMG